ncbi:MAG: class I SAM-dependent methyltransferase [Bdellovibrionota bacterium]
MTDRPVPVSTPEGWDSYWKGVRLPKLPGRFNPVVLHTKRALAKAFPQGAKSFFELGCAPGAWMALLARATGLRPAGCDTSPRGAGLARENLRLLGLSGDVYETDAFMLAPEKNGEHDLVYSLGFVEHFPDTKAILECHARVCRPGGRVFVNAPNLWGLSGVPYRRADPGVERSHLVLAPEALEAAAKAVGLNPLFCGYRGPLSAHVLLDRLASKPAFYAGYAVCTLLAALTYPVRGRYAAGTVCLLAEKP